MIMLVGEGLRGLLDKGLTKRYILSMYKKCTRETGGNCYIYPSENFDCVFIRSHVSQTDFHDT